MTQLALDWRKNLANELHMMRQDAETARHDKTVEAETERSNLAREFETNRSNLVREREEHRSNLARETETNRSNMTREAEEHRSNVTREKETHRANVTKEKETEAHDRAGEKAQWVALNKDVIGNAAAMSAMKDYGYGTGYRSELEDNWWRDAGLVALGGLQSLANTVKDAGMTLLGSKAGSQAAVDQLTYWKYKF